MGIASEIDTLLKKSKEVGLTLEEMFELERLWGFFTQLNKLYGVETKPFSEVLKEVKLMK